MPANLPFKYFQVKNETPFETKDGKVFRKKEKYHQINQLSFQNKDFLRVSLDTNINNINYESSVYSTPLEKIQTSYDNLTTYNDSLNLNNNFILPQHTIKILDFMSTQDIPALLSINNEIFDIETTNFAIDTFVIPIIDNSQTQSSIDQYKNVGNTVVKSDYLYVHDKTDSLNLKVISGSNGSYVINEKVVVTNDTNNGGNNSSSGQYKEFWA